jgi:hypothetical protein
MQYVLSGVVFNVFPAKLCIVGFRAPSSCWESRLRIFLEHMHNQLPGALGPKQVDTGTEGISNTKEGEEGGSL